MTQYSIPPNEVRFVSSASPLHRVRLFEWQNRLYRAIHNDSAPLFDQLFNDGVIERLMAKRLIVHTEATNLSLSDYARVIGHERLPFVTYPYEWSAAALKEAALAFIDLNLELAGHGLATSDSHPWNTVFDGARPVFVDLGSIARLTQIDAVNMLAEFERWFYHPLCLMAQGQHRLARTFLYDPINCVNDSELRRLGLATDRKWSKLAGKYVSAAVNRWRRVTGMQRSPGVNETPNPRQWRKMLENTRARVEAVALQDVSSAWSGYYDDEFPPLDQSQQWHGKHHALANLLKRLSPTTVHDVAGNRGWYSMLAEHLGSKVVCSDIDDPCLNALYRQARVHDLAITPVHLNLRNPSPNLGWSGREFPGAEARLQCDCVLALALMHHLVFRAMADFDTVLDGLVTLTRQDLVLEFVSPEDQFVSQWWTPRYDWYRLDELVNVAQRRFASVQVVPSHPHGRYLLLCERVNQQGAQPRIAA